MTGTIVSVGSYQSTNPGTGNAGTGHRRESVPNFVLGGEISVFFKFLPTLWKRVCCKALELLSLKLTNLYPWPHFSRDQLSSEIPLACEEEWWGFVGWGNFEHAVWGFACLYCIFTYVFTIISILNGTILQSGTMLVTSRNGAVAEFNSTTKNWHKTIQRCVLSHPIFLRWLLW